MEPTRASGSGEPRERLESAEGEVPEVEGLEIIGQEMVPFAGGRRPPRRMVEVVKPLELTATPLKPGQSEEELDPEPPRRWPNGPEGEPEAMKPLFTPGVQQVGRESTVAEGTADGPTEAGALARGE